jgi:hypothetical protein
MTGVSASHVINLLSGSHIEADQSTVITKSLLQYCHCKLWDIDQSLTEVIVIEDTIPGVCNEPDKNLLKGFVGGCFVAKSHFYPTNKLLQKVGWQTTNSLL